MAKRFSDSEKWKKKWFRELPPVMKCVREFLQDNCDHAGVWEIDMKTMHHFINDSTITLDQIVQQFGNKLKLLPDDKLWYMGFINFQYGVLKENYNPHKPALNRLKELGLTSTLQQPLTNTLESVMSKSKSKSKDKNKKEQSPCQKFHPLAILWNKNKRTELKKVMGCSGKRLESTRARWGENQKPKYWIEVIQKINNSKFCNGHNDRKWTADFDFLIKPSSAHKALEGKYDQGGFMSDKKDEYQENTWEQALGDKS